MSGNDEFPDCNIDGAQMVEVTQVAGGKGTYAFHGVQSGKYALSSFQDVDGLIARKNKKLDTVAGIPVERVGTYRAIDRRPKFEEISFDVPQTQVAEIKLLALF